MRRRVKTGSLLLAPLLALLAAALADAGDPAGCPETTVTVSVEWSRAAAPTAQGVVVGLAFPESVVLERDASGSAKERVRRLGASDGGLFDAVPVDTDDDGAADRVNVGLVAAEIAPGDFAEVRFACRPGGSAPQASAFTCEPQVAAAHGAIEATCAVAVRAGPAEGDGAHAGAERRARERPRS